MPAGFNPSSLKGAAFNLGKQAIKTKASGSPYPPSTSSRYYSPPPPPGSSVPGTSVPGYSSFRKTAATTASGHATAAARKAGKKYVDAYITIPRLVVRALQLVLALVAAGVYGHQVDRERKEAAAMSPEWLFAVVVAGLAAATAALFAAAAPLAVLSSRLETRKAWAWDLVLFVLWIAVFGTFAAIFLRRTDDMGPYKGAVAATGLMKAVVWVDLVSALLWLVSGTYGLARTVLADKADRIGGRVMGRMLGGNV